MGGRGPSLPTGQRCVRHGHARPRRGGRGGGHKAGPVALTLGRSSGTEGPAAVPPARPEPAGRGLRAADGKPRLRAASGAGPAVRPGARPLPLFGPRFPISGQSLLRLRLRLGRGVAAVREYFLKNHTPGAADLAPRPKVTRKEEPGAGHELPRPPARRPRPLRSWGSERVPGSFRPPNPSPESAPESGGSPAPAPAPALPPAPGAPLAPLHPREPRRRPTPRPSRRPRPLRPRRPWRGRRRSQWGGGVPRALAVVTRRASRVGQSAASARAGCDAGGAPRAAAAL